MKPELQQILDKLWSGGITHFYHDLLNHRLTFVVEIDSRPEMTFYKVAIDEISIIIFDEPNLEVTEDYNWDYMGMTSINYSPDCGFQYFPGYQDTPDYDYSRAAKEKEAKKVGAFNLLMEVNETAVYIRAKRLQINEKTFHLKF